MTRLKSEPNVYKTSNGAAYILVYVDDLLFIGQDNIVNDLFSAIQKQLLLRPTGELTMEQTISFPGRDITNKGDHYEISLSKGYTATMLDVDTLNLFSFLRLILFSCTAYICVDIAI